MNNHKCSCKCKCGADTKIYLCNICGESCTIGSESDNPRTVNGLIEATVTGAYMSTPGNGTTQGALDDRVRYKFSICEFCLDWLFHSVFKIPVQVIDLDGDDGEFNQLSALQRVLKSHHRNYKEEFIVEYKRHNQLRQIKSSE